MRACACHCWLCITGQAAQARTSPDMFGTVTPSTRLLIAHIQRPTCHQPRLPPAPHGAASPCTAPRVQPLRPWPVRRAPCASPAARRRRLCCLQSAAGARKHSCARMPAKARGATYEQHQLSMGARAVKLQWFASEEVAGQTVLPASRSLVQRCIYKMHFESADALDVNSHANACRHAVWDTVTQQESMATC